MCLLIPLTFNTTIVQLIAKSFFSRLWTVFLIVGFSMVAVSAAASAMNIGDEYGGGKVAWIDGTGQHGMIAAKADLPGGNSYSWNEATHACRDLVENGYSDWYLPTQAELQKLHEAKSAVGGFVDYSYWSSTEGCARYAWFQDFGIGSQTNDSKNFKWRVRPVRSF